MNKRHQHQESVTRRQLDQLRDDDAFLSALARGVDPSEGRDPLAALLLSAREEINRDIPAAPTLAALGIVAPENATDVTGEIPQVQDHHLQAPAGRFAQPAYEEQEEAPSASDAQVIPLRRKNRPFAHGLLGAAAASLVIAGTGTMIYNSEPGSPLYALNQQIFGAQDVEVVQLASTLQEANDRKAQGDIEGAKQKLAEAQALVNRMEPQGRKVGQSLVDRVSTTITETVTTTETAEKKTVTSTVTVTETSKVTTTPKPTDTASPTTTATPEETAPRVAPDPEAPVAEPAPEDPISRSIGDVVQGAVPEL